MSDLAVKTIKDAQANIGVKEDPPGSNWGKYIKIYLASVGITIPSPWCAAYVYYRISTAAKELNIKSTYIKSGSCQVVYNWAKKTNNLIKPQDNCVFLQWHDDLNRYAHTGLVVSYDAHSNTFITIEGNSNNDGSREGYEVCSNHRINTPGKYVFVKIV